MIPLTPETDAIARRVVWFEKPQDVLSDPGRFLAYAMTYATPADMKIIRRYISDDDFRALLLQIPPGIVDPRSWAYWHAKMGIYPPPAIPERRIHDVFI